MYIRITYILHTYIVTLFVGKETVCGRKYNFQNIPMSKKKISLLYLYCLNSLKYECVHRLDRRHAVFKYLASIFRQILAFCDNDRKYFSIFRLNRSVVSILIYTVDNL